MTDWRDTTFEVRLGPPGHGGFCVGRHEGRVVFVRHGLPGELVRVRVTEDRGGSFCRADAVQILEASPDRVPATCPVSGPGGAGCCDFSYATPKAQRALKASVVAEQLRRLAGIDREIVVEPITGSGDSTGGWRTRIRLAVDAEGRAGVHGYRSTEVITDLRCPQPVPGALDGIADRLWTPGADLVIAVDGDGVRHLIELAPAADGDRRKSRGGEWQRAEPGERRADQRGRDRRGRAERTDRRRSGAERADDQGGRGRDDRAGAGRGGGTERDNRRRPTGKPGSELRGDDAPGGTGRGHRRRPGEIGGVWSGGTIRPDIENDEHAAGRRGSAKHNRNRHGGLDRPAGDDRAVDGRDELRGVDGRRGEDAGRRGDDDRSKSPGRDGLDADGRTGRDDRRDLDESGGVDDTQGSSRGRDESRGTDERRGRHGSRAPRDDGADRNGRDGPRGTDDRAEARYDDDGRLEAPQAGERRNASARRAATHAARDEWVIAGTGRAVEYVAGRRWEVSATGFWQAHQGAAQCYSDLVAEWSGLHPGALAWDLYSGAGVFAARLADQVGQTGAVLAIESARPAVADGTAALRDLPWLDLHAQRVERWVTERVGGASPDVIVLDPPRAGAGKDVIAAITTTGPLRIIHIGCDPAAFARDLGLYQAAGYRLTNLRAFDAFPGTHHVECIALLEPAPSET
ncbi:TRAM domain-containing protein [Nocardia sp. NPDC051321]|uniref:TRAM domain-containing protein n=1 Tax=Nocardia sp. NPDC051321 TaxID=3364323 RepID=UPI0037B3531F